MTSDNSLLPILRRLDEIERKLDRMLEELRMPTAIRLFGAPGQSSKEGLNALLNLPRPVTMAGAPLIIKRQRTHR
jgi:hypothetical protein